MAHEARESDESLDWTSASIAQLDRPQPRPDPPPEWSEMFASLVAIGAAAYAIDGFYGSVRPLVTPPAASAKRPARWRRAIGVLLRSESRRSRRKRSRQIVETLKLGFDIGGERQGWLTQIDRLFDLRDDAVHHEEAFRPMVVYRLTGETIVAAAPELYDYSAERADWAVALAVEVLATCAERVAVGAAADRPVTARQSAVRGRPPVCAASALLLGRACARLPLRQRIGARSVPALPVPAPTETTKPPP